MTSAPTSLVTSPESRHARARNFFEPPGETSPQSTSPQSTSPGEERGPNAHVLRLRNFLQRALARPALDGLLERLRDAFGEKLFKDQIDFASEHSIALHLPWIQHLYGDVPVVAALIPDPNVGLIADDGERVGTKEFAAALKSILGQAGGRTLFVSSADLSHVGPQFGDQGPVDQKRKHAIEQHDRELLGEYIEGAD